MLQPDAFLEAHAADEDWHAALSACRRRIDAQVAARPAGAPPLTLGWLYLSDYYAEHAESILRELRNALPGVAWVGTAGVGVSATGVEFIDEPALSLMLAPLSPESFRVFSGREPLGAASPRFAPHTALVHAEGSTPDLQELLRELGGRTATGYLFGGLSSARNRTLHIANEVYTGGLSGVAFDARVGLVSRVTQGCQPIGPLRTITNAQHNCVLSLDGRKALDCAIDDLGLDSGVADRTLSSALGGTLVGLLAEGGDAPAHPGQFGADTVVRHLIGVDRQHGILAVAERVEPGTRLAFCKRDPAAAQRDLVRIATEIRDEIESSAPRRISGGLYVSCSGRGGPHFGARNAELEIVRAALPDVPLVGFFAGGEIARDHLYGYTGVLTVFTGPR